MRNSSYFLVLLAVVVAVASVFQARPAFSAPSEVMQSVAATAPVKSIANMSDVELRDAITRFVENFYLAGEDLSEEQLEAIYAPVVNYFGNRRKTRASIVRDQRRYYRRWPDRNFELISGTLNVVRTDQADEIVDVVFEYFFETRSGKRKSRGRGVTMLTLDFSVAGGQIIRERGEVTERFR